VAERIIIVAVLLAAGMVRADSSVGEPVPVTYVDLKRYAGTWFEIAKIPNRFQKQCVGGTTARYSLRDDGRIDVVNSCLTEDGSRDETRGVARIEDKISNARLKVSFVRFLGFSLFWGDYWVIGLADDYSYAVVGTPDRKYGWILSRTPQLPEEELDRIFSLLRAQGYDPADFEMTRQSAARSPAPTPEGDSP
jgi:apolipoprotein D and lipocalin family protein